MEHIQDSWYSNSRYVAGKVSLPSSINRSSNAILLKTFQELPDASKVTFISVPSVSLASLLPNLPQSTKPESAQATSHSPPETMAPSPFDLLHRFLVYPQLERLRAAEALQHSWFTVDPMPLPPSAYPLGNKGWEGTTLGERLHANLPRKKPLAAVE